MRGAPWPGAASDTGAAGGERRRDLVRAENERPGTTDWLLTRTRVDPKTRTTPVGAILSHNQVEQIRQGKLVIDRGTNAILYIG